MLSIKNKLLAGFIRCAMPAVVLTVVACGKKPVETGYPAVVGFEVERREVLGDGVAFGGAGSFEVIVGRVGYELDPADPRNRRVTDIEGAKDPDGRLRYEAEVVLVKPVDIRRGNGALLYTVVNRGNFDTRLLDPGVWASVASSPSGSAERTGRLLKQGFTLVFSGWQADLIDSPERLCLFAPEARENGAAMTGRALAVIEVGQTGFQASLADPNHRVLAVMPGTEQDAVMRVHETMADPGEQLPRESWRFARIESADTVPDRENVVLHPGFQPGKIYTVEYRPDRSPVMGLGFTAVRDLVAFLLSPDSLNPLLLEDGSSGVGKAVAYGSSQSGRFLRDFLYQGFNASLQDSVVFSGVFSNVPGCRRGFFNYRFAQPSRSWGFYPQFEFPFADIVTTDPLTGESGGIQAGLEPGFRPKTFYVHHSAEYWSSGSALTHADVQGEKDIEPPDNVRIYLIRGTAHGRAALDGGRPQETPGYYLPFNPNDAALVEGPLLDALCRWVMFEEHPPASSYPRLDKGELVAVEEFAFPQVPDIGPPVLVELHPRFDWGPRFAAGILDNPMPGIGQLYPVLVPAVGEDGNELTGIAPPMVAVPLASYTGWNYPAWFESVETTAAVRLSGAWLPFPADRDERMRRVDGRKSVAERYRGKGFYLESLRKAAEDLVQHRLMFPEDVGRVVEQGGEMWDWVVKNGAWKAGK